MKKTRFTEEQMVTILREADAKPVPEVAKKHGVSAQTIYALAQAFRDAGARRRQAAATAGAGERTAEEDGRRPRSGDRRAQGDHAKKMVGARVRRQQVAYAEGRGLSRRRACALLSVARSTLGYSRGWSGAMRRSLAAMRAIGGPVSAVWLPPGAHLSGAARARDECRPGVSGCGARRDSRCPGAVRGGVWRSSRPRPLPPTAANHVWAYDFVFDTCADGRALKCLTVVDEYTRECLAIDVAGSIRSGRVIEVLAQLVSVHGAPRHLRSDNGLP